MGAFYIPVPWHYVTVVVALWLPFLIRVRGLQIDWVYETPVVGYTHLHDMYSVCMWRDLVVYAALAKLCPEILYLT